MRESWHRVSSVLFLYPPPQLRAVHCARRGQMLPEHLLNGRSRKQQLSGPNTTGRIAVD
jgi:hypothetical protein